MQPTEDGSTNTERHTDGPEISQRKAGLQNNVGYAVG